jgi:peptidoglycan/xylan/chitin deacetylase (PgdA/CDA1 family)
VGRRTAFLSASEWCARSAGDTQARIISKIEQDLDVETLQTRVCATMTWDQVRGLRRAGHLIGSHTLTHPNLAYVDQETQWREILESKIQLEEKLGWPVDYFSYPNPIMCPNFTDRTVESTRRAGYKLAVTMMRGPVRFGHDPQALPRVPAPPEGEELAWYADNALIGRQL